MRYAPLLFCLALAALMPVLRVSTAAAATGDMGTMALDAYEGSGCTLWNLHWSNFRNAFRTRLAAHGWQEIPPFPIDNAAATSYDLDKYGCNWGDTVDLFVWTGHAWVCEYPGAGGPGEYPEGDRDGGACLHMISQHDRDATCICNDPYWAGCHHYNRDCGNINHNEIRWGLNRNKVAVVVTCEWHRNATDPDILNKIKHMHNGNHLMLSFASHAWDGDPYDTLAGQWFEYYLMGDYSAKLRPLPIYYAWGATIEKWQPSGVGVIGRVHLWQGCFTDYLPGNWKHYGFGVKPPCCHACDDNLNAFTWWDYPK